MKKYKMRIAGNGEEDLCGRYNLDSKVVQA